MCTVCSQLLRNFIIITYYISGRELPGCTISGCVILGCTYSQSEDTFCWSVVLTIVCGLDSGLLSNCLEFCLLVRFVYKNESLKSLDSPASFPQNVFKKSLNSLIYSKLNQSFYEKLLLQYAQ